MPNPSDFLSREISNVGAKESLHDREVDRFAKSGECALGVNVHHHWRTQGSREGKGGDRSPRGFFLTDT